MTYSTLEPLADSADALNALLLGELAAVETYTRAIAQFADETLITDLQTIRDEHSRAVRKLSDQVALCGGRPASESEAWCTFTTLVTGVGKSPGSAMVLAALLQGEEQAVATYESALKSDSIQAQSVRSLRSDLMPACRKNIEHLNRLLGGG